MRLPVNQHSYQQWAPIDLINYSKITFSIAHCYINCRSWAWFVGHRYLTNMAGRDWTQHALPSCTPTCKRCIVKGGPLSFVSLSLSLCLSLSPHPYHSRGWSLLIVIYQSSCWISQPQCISCLQQEGFSLITMYIHVSTLICTGLSLFSGWNKVTHQPDNGKHKKNHVDDWPY